MDKEAYQPYMSEQHNKESRLYTRVTYNVLVSIFYNGQLIGKRIARNISVGGVLVETDDLGLPLNSLVEIEITAPNNTSLSVVRTPGVVNRAGRECIAIEFERLDKDVEDIIKKYLALEQKLTPSTI